MKKSQLNAISYAYSEKKRKEQEQRAAQIQGFKTAYKHSGYKTLTGALNNIGGTFTRAEKNIEKEIENIEKEIERATVKGCKKIYLEQLNDKREHLEQELKEIQRGGATRNER